MANATTYLQNPTTGSSVAAERKNGLLLVGLKELI